MDTGQILKQHNLKNTGCRKLIISELLLTNTAMSEHKIKSNLPNLFDRVTFYRSLKTLEEFKIIHRVILSDASVKYAISKDSLANVEHPHFHCIKCNEVICLEAEVKAPADLPSGFLFDSAQVLFEGTCPSCKNDNVDYTK